MKKYKRFGFIGICLFVLLTSFLYQNNKVNTEKETFNQFNSSFVKNGYVSAMLDIDKRNEEGETLTSARFSLSTYNGVESFTSRTASYGAYIDEYNYGEAEYFEELKNVLSAEQKNVVDQIKTTDDFKKIAYGNYVECYEYGNFASTEAQGNNEESGAEYRITSDYYCDIPLPTIFYLEETKAPAGYAKDKLLVPGTIMLKYQIMNYVINESYDTLSQTNPQFRYSDYFNTNYNVELVGISVTNVMPSFTMDYGKVETNKLVGTDIDTADTIWKNNANIARVCNNTKLADNIFISNYSELREVFLKIASTRGQSERTNTNSSLLYSPEGVAIMCNTAMVVNKKGTVDLEISSSVNNVESLTTNINQNLQYRVTVKNKGNIDAIDNVVKAKVPDDFVYVEGSATDGGVYADGTITWVVGRIYSEKEVTLSYLAYAPKGVNTGQDYIGEASVDSFSVNQRVDSNKTMVRLSLTNPSTYAPLSILFIIAIVAAWTVYLLTKYYQKQRTQE